ncbi:hypothetical protein GCM10010344_01650 [Streptomyces bluensis]|nr:hypothetical protein GCM10010344_01650 [Streptomyces bluensis]
MFWPSGTGNFSGRIWRLSFECFEYRTDLSHGCSRVRASGNSTGGPDRQGDEQEEQGPLRPVRRAGVGREGGRGNDPAARLVEFGSPFPTVDQTPSLPVKAAAEVPPVIQGAALARWEGAPLHALSA